MNLDEFISETLKGIIKGINDTETYAKDNNAVINPVRPKGDGINYNAVEINGNIVGYNRFTTISFDIAVTASNQSESGVNGGIKVLSLNIGGKMTDVNQNETVSNMILHLIHHTM
jgi:hypothetical protein